MTNAEFPGAGRYVHLPQIRLEYMHIEQCLANRTFLDSAVVRCSKLSIGFEIVAVDKAEQLVRLACILRVACLVRLGLTHVRKSGSIAMSADLYGDTLRQKVVTPGHRESCHVQQAISRTLHREEGLEPG